MKGRKFVYIILFLAALTMGTWFNAPRYERPPIAAAEGISESIATNIADSFRLPLDNWSIILQDFGLWNSFASGYHLG